MKKEIYVPCSLKCTLCSQPETTFHRFIHCHDAFVFCDILKRTIRKSFPITAHGIRFLPFKQSTTNNTPYDFFMLSGKCYVMFAMEKSHDWQTHLVTTIEKVSLPRPSCSGEQCCWDFSPLSSVAYTRGRMCVCLTFEMPPTTGNNAGVVYVRAILMWCLMLCAYDYNCRLISMH